MAEAIPFSIVTEILKKLGASAVKEIELVCSVKDEARKMGGTVSTINAVLVDAEKKRSENHEIGDWLAKLNDAVYDADDLLDDFSTESLRRKVMTQNKGVKKVRIFFSSSNQLIFSLKTGHKIKAIRERLDAISADRNDFHFTEQPLEIGSETKISRESHSFVCVDKVIGREDDKKAIVKSLMNCNVQENVSVVAIVGIGGIGKTELAKSVYNDDEVSKHFERKMWVCVSDVFDVKQIVEKVVESASGKKPEGLQMDRVQNDLRREIDGKKYLLVLDDVWNEDGEQWIRLKGLLMGGTKGSMILITTRSELVATVSKTNSMYSLKGLSGEESWSLFKQLAFKDGKEPDNPRLVEIGKEITEKCAGVPLAIRILGSLLYSKDTEKEWFNFKDKDMAKIAQETEIKPMLKLSYDHLPSYLKQCFAFCRLYPKDHIIDKQELIQLWMAHGFIQLSDNSQDMEDVGDSYFMDLLRRSFFQDDERDDFGNVISCKMHDLMHDLAQLVAGCESSIVSLDAKDVSSRTRHMSFDLSMGINFFGTIPTHLLRAIKIRTFLMPSTTYMKLEKSVCEMIVSIFKRLRVLDMHNLGMKTVPSGISELRHLRYLDLSYNGEIKTLPNSITKLQNLQTLKLNRCEHLKELPRDIRKMVSLRHLEFDGCIRLSDDMPRGMGQLTSLRTLTQFNVGPCNRLRELKDLNNLRGELKINLPVEWATLKEEAEEANLKGKKYLESLSLSFWNSKKEEEEEEEEEKEVLVLEALRPHANLKELRIYGYGVVRLPTWMMSLSSFIPNLVHVSLFECNGCKHLPKFEQLPSLRALILGGLTSIEYIDDNYSTCSSTGTAGGNELDDESLISSSFPSSSSRGGRREPTTTTFFPSLKCLELWDMPNLKGWWRSKVAVEDEEQSTANNQEVQLLLPSFPCLLQSEITDCPRLTSMPLQPTVVKLELWNVSEKVVQQQLLMMPTPTTPTVATPSCSASLVPLSNLEELYIGKIEDLVTLPEVAFQRLTSLRRLKICYCGRLTSLSRGMRHLTALRFLEINCCKELDLSDGDDYGMHFQGLNNLTSLDIFTIPKLKSLPAGLQRLTTLQSLFISDCDNLRSLPEWIGNLTALQQLYISNCPRWKTLPEGMRRLTALQHLQIEYCSQELNDRFQKETGKDWHKIAHIPNVQIRTSYT